MVCLSVIWLCYRVTCLWFCNKIFLCNKKGVLFVPDPVLCLKHIPRFRLSSFHKLTVKSENGCCTGLHEFRRFLCNRGPQSPGHGSYVEAGHTAGDEQQVSQRSVICIHSHSPLLSLSPDLHLLSDQRWHKILIGVWTLLWTAYVRDLDCMLLKRIWRPVVELRWWCYCWGVATNTDYH